MRVVNAFVGCCLCLVVAVRQQRVLIIGAAASAATSSPPSAVEVDPQKASSATVTSSSSSTTWENKELDSMAGSPAEQQQQGRGCEGEAANSSSCNNKLGDEIGAGQPHPPILFQLYDDFDISTLIRGDEDWEELLHYRNQLERPSLSFYVDKVARKRWLPGVVSVGDGGGYRQPTIYALLYRDELITSTGTGTGNTAKTAASRFPDEVKAIRKLLPADHRSYAAKPTHMSHSMGTWLVDPNPNSSGDDGDDDGAAATVTTGTKTEFSVEGKEVTNELGEFDEEQCATALAAGLHSPPAEFESWALKNVQPGLVVEERWSSSARSRGNPKSPPDEFCLFTIWGRVWVAQWNTVVGQDRYYEAFIYRNQTVASGGVNLADHGKPLPDWVPWEELVRVAEELGANKDMFRVDIFVGHPSHQRRNNNNNSSQQIQIAVSECEIFPTTVFYNEELTREGARIWLDGYRLGAGAYYEVVPNTEVPQEFIETGKLSDQCPIREEEA